MDQRHIRLKTVLIVERDGTFLKGLNPITGCLEWSWSKYDAWSTRHIPSAEIVAQKTGGDLWIFNPILSQSRPYKGAAK